jgi:hypothetical protein
MRFGNRKLETSQQKAGRLIHVNLNWFHTGTSSTATFEALLKMSLGAILKLQGMCILLGRQGGHALWRESGTKYEPVSEIKIIAPDTKTVL